MIKILGPQSAAFLIVFGITGLAFTLIGVLVKDSAPLLFNVFTTMGGTIFGSAVGITFARIFEPSPVSGLMTTLAEINNSSILCRTEASLEHFRKRMYGYLRSRDESGNPVWRYRVFDFSMAKAPGHLHTKVKIRASDRESKDFIYDGYICGQHLVLIGQPVSDSEPHVIHVFPDALRQQIGCIAGICFVDSFDGSKLLAPTLLSIRKLTDQGRPDLVPVEDQSRLTRSWKELFTKHNQLNFDTDGFEIRA